MNWQLVFDIADPRTPDRNIVLGVAGVAGLAAAIWYWHASTIGGETEPAIFLAFLAVAMLVVGVIVPAHDARNTLAALREGSARVVEGVVAGHRCWQQRSARVNAKPLAPTGDISNRESIMIGGIEFEFSAGEYQRMMQRQGLTPVALRDGLWLRIHWRDRGKGEPKDRHIARIEWLPSRSTPPVT